MTPFFRTLNEAVIGPESDLTAILRGLSEGMGWAGFGVWQYSPEARALEEVASWAAPAPDGDGRGRWTTVRAGVVESAWNDGAVTDDSGHVAVPIRLAGRPVAVLTFATGENGPVSRQLRTELAEAGAGAFAHLYSMYRHTLSPAVLTAREREVLQWSAEGNGTAQIAAGLNVAHSTVKTHFENLYVKLGVTDRAAAVAQGFRRGLLT